MNLFLRGYSKQFVFCMAAITSSGCLSPNSPVGQQVNRFLDRGFLSSSGNPNLLIGSTALPDQTFVQVTPSVANTAYGRSEIFTVEGGSPINGPGSDGNYLVSIEALWSNTFPQPPQVRFNPLTGKDEFTVTAPYRNDRYRISVTDATGHVRHVTLNSVADAGSPDLSFGQENGYAFPDLTIYGDILTTQHAARDSQGGFWIAGTRITNHFFPEERDFFLTKLQPDGTYDPRGFSAGINHYLLVDGRSRSFCGMHHDQNTNITSLVRKTLGENARIEIERYDLRGNRINPRYSNRGAVQVDVPRTLQCQSYIDASTGGIFIASVYRGKSFNGIDIQRVSQNGKVLNEYISVGTDEPEVIKIFAGEPGKVFVLYKSTEQNTGAKTYFVAKLNETDSSIAIGEFGSTTVGLNNTLNGILEIHDQEVAHIFPEFSDDAVRGPRLEGYRLITRQTDQAGTPKLQISEILPNHQLIDPLSIQYSEIALPMLGEPDPYGLDREAATIKEIKPQLERASNGKMLPLGNTIALGAFEAVHPVYPFPWVPVRGFILRLNGTQLDTSFNETGMVSHHLHHRSVSGRSRSRRRLDYNNLFINDDRLTVVGDVGRGSFTLAFPDLPRGTILGRFHLE